MKRMIPALFLAALALPAGALELGEDGLYEQPWFTATFKDVAEDIADAADEGKRLAIIFEQRGCIYCKKLHEEVFSDEEIADYIAENFVVVRYNLYGDEEVTDVDGETLTEKEAAQRWGVVFTPTVMFMDENVEDGESFRDVLIQTMPGAFGKGTTRDMFTWIREKGYEGDEGFQRYHARMIEARVKRGGGTD